MRWTTLYNKIGKQNLGITSHCDVTILTKDGEKPLVIKYDNQNRPFFEIDETRKTFAIMDKQVVINKTGEDK